MKHRGAAPEFQQKLSGLPKLLEEQKSKREEEVRRRKIKKENPPHWKDAPKRGPQQTTKKCLDCPAQITGPLNKLRCLGCLKLWTAAEDRKYASKHFHRQRAKELQVQWRWCPYCFQTFKLGTGWATHLRSHPSEFKNLIQQELEFRNTKKLDVHSTQDSVGQNLQSVLPDEGEVASSAPGYPNQPEPKDASNLT